MRQAALFLSIALVLLVISTASFAGQHILNHGCKPCHVPHHAGSEPEMDVPLWSGNATTVTFTMYSSSTMDATQPTGPTGSSKLCLSCHDGTDPVVGEMHNVPLPGGGTIQVPRQSNFQNDLSRNHPVSIDYEETIANDSAFKPVASVTTGYLRQGEDGKYYVQCASCHDVHDQEGVGFSLLRGHAWYDGGEPWGDGSTGGDLCLECHIK